MKKAMKKLMKLSTEDKLYAAGLIFGVGYFVCHVIIWGVCNGFRI